MWSTRFKYFNNWRDAENWHRETKGKNIDFSMAGEDPVKEMYSAIEAAKDPQASSAWEWVGFKKEELNKTPMVTLCCHYDERIPKKNKPTVIMPHILWFGMDRGPYTRYDDRETDFDNVRRGKGMGNIAILPYLDIK